ncbi:hypothetical protein Chor_000689, partial [Crotalus horridus]
VISTASELGVFDLLRESREPLSSTTVAERLSTSPIGMQRLLEACVGLKLLTLEWKDGKDLYGNTDFANLYLVKSSPKSQYNSMKFYSEVIYSSMQYLPDAVRSYCTVLERVKENWLNETFRINSELSKYRKTFRIYFYAEENAKMIVLFLSNFLKILLGKEKIRFHQYMALPQTRRLRSFTGSTGGLPKELISLYPKCTVTVFDLPEIVEASKNHCFSSEETRIIFHAGDFFKDPIPEADLYILARTLHNWSDESCLQLLCEVYQACKPGGGVLIVEMLLDEDRRGPLAAHIYALLMLLYFEGKERSATELNVLLRKAGFQEVELKKGSLFHIILGRK